MDARVLERLAVLMARLAAGDGAAVHALLEEFGRPIQAAVRRHLGHLGVPPTAELLSELTVEACLVLADCAAGWSPAGGALPWNWAERRLRTCVAGFVGQHADALDGDRAQALASPPAMVAPGDEEEDVVLAALAQRLPEAGLVHDAFEAVTTPLQQRVVLAYAMQQRAGDPSPAVTVGRRFGLSPANVRQMVCRAKARLRHLAATDGRYAPLADLPLLA